jgi:hypothetical protein
MDEQTCVSSIMLTQERKNALRYFICYTLDNDLNEVTNSLSEKRTVILAKKTQQAQ